MRFPLKACLLTLSLIANSTKAGIDKFTRLDRINGWDIERRIDSDTQEIRCRASIPNHYAWFGGKVRINNQGVFHVPEGVSKDDIPDKAAIREIIEAIKTCKKGLIYKIQID